MSAKQRFHKQVFERISDEKREKIFEAAIGEFALQGYGASNINTIAANAGVSVGSMYTYFQSKEDLFLAMAEKGIKIFQEILAEVTESGDGFFSSIERLFYLTIRYAREHEHLCRIYLELTTEQMGSMTERLSHKMEVDFCEFYLDLIEKAKEAGEIARAVDSRLLGFHLDNMVVSLQMAFSTTYYKLRLVQYLGGQAAADEDAIVAGLMAFVRGSAGNVMSGQADG